MESSNLLKPCGCDIQKRSAKLERGSSVNEILVLYYRCPLSRKGDVLPMSWRRNRPSNGKIDWVLGDVTISLSIRCTNQLARMSKFRYNIDSIFFSTKNLDDWMLKTWLAHSILPQRAVLQVCYSWIICFGPTLFSIHRRRVNDYESELGPLIM